MTQEGLGGLDADARSLIEDSRHAYEPAPGMQARVRNRLQVSLAAGAGVAGYGALAGAASSKLLAAVVTVGLAGSGAWYAAHRSGSRTHASPVQEAIEPKLRVPQVSARAVVVTSAPAAPVPPAAMHSPAAARAAFNHAQPIPDLAQETQLLRLVNAAIQRRDGNAALSLLNDYDRRFKPPLLFAERSAARVFALCSLGRSAAATTEAQRFVRRFPLSPLVSRVVASCARPAPGKPPAP